MSDGDGDGVSDEVDNCPSTVNPDQTNTDGDPTGDACDLDDDDDGVDDAADNCPLTPNPDQIDSDDVIGGRGIGKSRMGALIRCCLAVREYKRAPGEQVFVGIFAPDRKQAGVTFRYVLGLLRSVPELEALIVAERAESIDLANGVTIEVITASMAAPRGRSYACPSSFVNSSVKWPGSCRHPRADGPQRRA